jgi:hypothetical protein
LLLFIICKYQANEENPDDETSSHKKKKEGKREREGEKRERKGKKGVKKGKQNLIYLEYPALMKKDIVPAFCFLFRIKVAHNPTLFLPFFYF